MADFSWVPKELEGRFSYVSGKLMASCERCGAMRHTSGRGAVLKDIESKGTERYILCGSCGVYKGMKPTKQEIASWPEGSKGCSRCKKVKPFSEFHKHRTSLFGYNTICKVCRMPMSKENWNSKPYQQKMFERAKSRANSKGREFSISVEDIVIPEFCPVFHVRLVTDDPGSPMAPSLDRIDSSRGYTPDNIQVISTRANLLKLNMTMEELEMLYAFLILP